MVTGAQFYSRRKRICARAGTAFLLTVGLLPSYEALAQTERQPKELAPIPHASPGPVSASAYEKVLDLRFNPTDDREDQGEPLKEQSDAFYERYVRNEDRPARTSAIDDEGSIRIVGGQPSRPGAWPSAVVLHIYRQKGDGLCGGSIIDQHWVLTAAHCVFDPRAGLQDLKAATAFEGSNILAKGRPLKVAEVLVHGQYEPARFINDIALLRLADPARAPRQKLSAGVSRPVFLAPGNMATIVGWGRIQESGTVSQQLLEAKVPVTGQQKCVAAYQKIGKVVTDASFCAGYDQGGTDSCQGDSGGPIYVAGAHSEPVQSGIVSWGEGCARAELYGVYTTLGHFEQWIRQRVPNAAFVVARAPAASGGADQSLQQISGGAQGGEPAPNGQVAVDVVPGPRVKVGSEITVRITTGVTGHLVVFNRNAEGKAYQIFPNKFTKGGQPGVAPTQVKAGQVITIPGPMDAFALKTAPPTGRNEIIAAVVPEGVRVEDVTRQFDAMTAIPNYEEVLAQIADRTTRNVEIVRRAPRAVGSRQFEITP